MAVAGWWADQRQETVAYLVEENRILRAHLRGRIRLTDEERRRLAVHGHRLGRRRLRQVATIVTPDTMLRSPSTSTLCRTTCTRSILSILQRTPNPPIRQARLQTLRWSTFRAAFGLLSERRAHPTPFVWTKSADAILASIARFAQRTVDARAAQHMSRVTVTGH